MFSVVCKCCVVNYVKTLSTEALAIYNIYKNITFYNHKVNALYLLNLFFIKFIGTQLRHK